MSEVDLVFAGGNYIGVDYSCLQVVYGREQRNQPQQLVERDLQRVLLVGFCVRRVTVRPDYEEHEEWDVQV